MGRSLALYPKNTLAFGPAGKTDRSLSTLQSRLITEELIVASYKEKVAAAGAFHATGRYFKSINSEWAFIILSFHIFMHQVPTNILPTLKAITNMVMTRMAMIAASIFMVFKKEGWTNTTTEEEEEDLTEEVEAALALQEVITRIPIELQSSNSRVYSAKILKLLTRQKSVEKWTLPEISKSNTIRIEAVVVVAIGAQTEVVTGGIIEAHS